MTPVFVWRATTAPYEAITDSCVYCQSIVRVRRITETSIEADEKLKELYRSAWSAVYSRNYGARDIGGAETAVERFDNSHVPMRTSCDRCGWWMNRLSYPSWTVNTRAAALRTFDLGDSELAIPEIMSHLSRHFKDRFMLSSRRLEEVVGGVYSQMGYEVQLTKQTRDGGVDLLCLKKGSGEICIVEVKRYKKENKVGIMAVDRLIGAAIRFNATQAHLVTTSSFTRPAVEAKQMVKEQILAVNLIDAHQLLILLECYSDPTLTVRDVRAIFHS